MKSPLSWRFILRVIAVISCLVSIAWIIREPHHFNPWLALIAGMGMFAGSFIVSDKPIRIAQISEEQIRARDRRNRAAMLKLVNEIWVNGVLNKSLHNAVLIELGLEERKDAVYHPDRPWDMVLQTTDKPNRVLPPGTRIVDVFDDVGQALLILGKPGSGKTTTLLQLARQTISRAEENPTQPIPVVFNLSSWINPAQSIADWLIDELNTKYNIARKIAQPWVENDQLLLLLDGLDEVAEQKRDACVGAINKFRREHLVQIVICSRTAEYESLATSLKLNSAICIQPLKKKQISDYLDKFGGGLAALRNMLQDDEPQQELSRSPLMLNIMTLSYQGASAEELGQLDTIEARRNHLFNKYIDRMFTRVARTKSRLYSRAKTIKWLSWLAEKMSRHAQSVFLIERMQSTWLETWAQERQYANNAMLIVGLISGLLIGLIAVLIGELIGRPMRWLIVGPIFGLIAGLVWGRSRQKIETVESLKWSWKNVKMGLILGLIGGLIWGPIFGLIAGLIVGLIGGLTGWLIVGLTGGLIFGLTGGLIVGLILGLIFGPIWGAFVSGLSYADVKERIVPNQGIGQSIRNSVIVLLAVIIGLLPIAALLASLFVVLGTNVGLDSTIVKVLVGAPFLAVAFLGFFFAFIEYGGLAVIKHFILRFILYRNGYLPWNIVRFLDYATERIFLQKVGGGYIFIHRLLRDHFASLNQSQ